MKNELESKPMPLVRNLLRSIVATTLLCCSLSSLADNTVVKKSATPKPGRISSQLLLIGDELVREQWPGTLALVNAPRARKMALPGQCISIAVVATGDERDSLLRETTFNFEVEFAGQKQIYDGLHPTGIKRLKPEGGDFVAEILGAASVDPKSLPDMSMASLATFDLGWCVPKDIRDGKAAILGSAILPKGPALPFQKINLPIVSYATAGKEGAFKNKEEFGAWFMTYYQQPNPSRVLAACRLLSNDNMAFTLNIRTFLIEVLKLSPEAASDLQTRLSGESPETRGYAMHLLQKAGYDITPLMAKLSEKERAYQEEFLRRTPPLADPYDLRVNPEHFDTPNRLDALWSIFLVTGKQKPVRAIADMLMWHEDYPALQEAQKTPKQPKPMTPALGRGVSYMVAGWSLGSFVRQQPLVADFVDAWKVDPNTPKVIKDELGNLFVNEAFKRK